MVYFTDTELAFISIVHLENGTPSLASSVTGAVPYSNKPDFYDLRTALSGDPLTPSSPTTSSSAGQVHVGGADPDDTTTFTDGSA